MGTVQTYGSTDTAKHIRACIFNGASSGEWLDGTSIFSSNVNTGTIDTGGILVGSGQGGTTIFKGAIAEIIIYNSALNTTDRQSTESYLNTRWFIASGGPQPLPMRINM